MKVMNERIRKFAEQQGLTGANYLISSQELEKFAELIVRECIRCCDDVDAIQKHYLKYGIDQELDAKQCIEVIKKHFGVEE